MTPSAYASYLLPLVRAADIFFALNKIAPVSSPFWCFFNYGNDPFIPQRSDDIRHKLFRNMSSMPSSLAIANFNYTLSFTFLASNTQEPPNFNCMFLLIISHELILYRSNFVCENS